MYLPAERTELARIESEVRCDDRERRVPRRRADGKTGRQPLLDTRNERAPGAFRTVVVSADDVSLPVDDRADRVHDRERRHLCSADLAEGAALAGTLALLVG